MSPSVLLDTGPILAMLNRQDRWYGRCTQTFIQLHKPLLTSEAVLTEAFYMLGDSAHRVEAAWTFVRSGAITVGTISDKDLPALAQLMQQYQDRPMDFADATLVRLAEREQLTSILTIDFSDFETYRIDGRKRFRILPGTVRQP
jgi:predicted nucleic acid-binding protein